MNQETKGDALTSDFERIDYVKKKWQGKFIQGRSHTQEERILFLDVGSQQPRSDFVLPKIKRKDTFMERNYAQHRPNKTDRSKDTISYDPPAELKSRRENLLQLSHLANNYEIFKGQKSPQSSNQAYRKEIEYLTEFPVPEPRSKLELQQLDIDGIKYPINLYMIHQTRRNFIRGIKETRTMVNQSELIESQRKDIEQRILSNEQVKLKNDYRSRSMMNGAVYGIQAMNNDQKKRVKLQLNQILPLESRFKMI